MHTIEPFYKWRKFYISEKDFKSPFFGREYSIYECYNSVYNYYIHPQWDEFGSDTLYLKVLFADYNKGYCILEFIGEWNDTLYNDIMFLKHKVIDMLTSNGITKFILIGENVLNFHASDDLYYEEWFDDIEDGWIVAVNFREHLIQEFSGANIDYYITFSLNHYNWRVLTPDKLFLLLQSTVIKKIS